jgi:hypothetical protein
LDQEEKRLREQELLTQRKSTRNSMLIAAASFLVSALAVVASVYVSQRQLSQSSVQYRQSLRDDHYDQIISGLESPAAAVQINSMRMLTEFVSNPDNYPDKTGDHPDKAAVDAGVEDAVRTLSAFIEDNSSTPHDSGLSDYQSPQPIVVSRAVGQLAHILGDGDLGEHVADISRGNLHGISLPGFAPPSAFLAVGTDFRRANLSGLNFGAAPASLESAFFTCSNLSDARLGDADVSGADLTGADLTGADLSRVKNLTAAQLSGVTVSSATRLPPDLDDTPRAGWGTRSLACFQLVNKMTGMRGGQGFTDKLPCPETAAASRRFAHEMSFDGSLSDLVTACRMRVSPGVTR